MRLSMRGGGPGQGQTVMAATSGTAAYGDPDMALIGELLEEISRHPPAFEALKLLVELYISVGWLDAARENSNELKRLAPRDADVIRFLQILEKKPEPPAQEKILAPTVTKTQTSTPASTSVSQTRVWDPKLARYVEKDAANISNKTDSSPVEINGDLESARQEFTQGHRSIRAKARYVLADLLHLQALQKKAGLPQSKNTVEIKAIVKGSTTSTVATVGPPKGVKLVARTAQDNPNEATNLIITDFEENIAWLRKPKGNPSGVKDDTIRDALVKRKTALEAVLPDSMKIHCELALMHIEHERIERNYANTETMLGDEVKDIPRTTFYATEDNYAWDMDELVQAIKANSGIFRNPLSKEMFTQKDVKGILTHTLGKPLAALAVEQHEMSKGVREATIVQMEALAKILLEDQTSDAVPSRKAVDEFLAYVATLPDFEQKTIDGLKCPAKDGHTGQAYDCSIGESVRDAKGNRVCFHKTGDFIKQAAAHLRQNRGVASDPDRCSVM